MIGSYALMFRLFDRRQRWRFRFLVALMMLAGLADLVGVAMILPFLAVVANPETIEARDSLRLIYETLGFETAFDFVKFLGLAVFAAVMAGIAIRALTTYLQTRFWRGVAMTLGIDLLRRYLSHPYEWFLQHHSADLGKSILEEVHDVVVGSVAPGMRVIANLIVLICLVGLLVAVEPLGATVMGALLVVCFGLIYRRLRAYLGRIGADRRVAKREKHQITAEALKGIKEVKTLGLEDAYLHRFVDPSARVARHQAAVAILGEMPRFALEALAFGGMLLFMIWLMWSRDGALEEALPVLGAFAFAGLKLMPVIQQLFRDVAEMRFARAALEGLHDDLTTAPPAIDAAEDAGPPLPLREALTFENVRYRYPGADRDSLADVSLTIPAGSCVGFVGPTGAGKTTVMDVALGLISPRSGALRVDGEVVDRGNVRRWRRQIGFVPQSIFLVDDTIVGNIAFGVPTAEIDRGAAEEAGRLACLDEFARALPDGYDTIVGEAGVRLSGGQRQRIGIARALYRDPAVLVFDEATSALDAATEREVIDALRGLKGGKTILMVAHRLSTVARCDTIFVLKEGRLAGAGDYETLAAENEAFRLLVAATDRSAA